MEARRTDVEGMCGCDERAEQAERGRKDGRRGAAAAISCIVCAGLSMRRGTSGSSRDVDTLFFSILDYSSVKSYNLASPNGGFGGLAGGAPTCG